MYRYVLEQRNPIVRHPQGVDKDMKPFPFKDTQLFAGSTTSRLKGVPLYPEFLALTLWPELWTITKRESNPFYITEDEVKNLNQEVFPPFLENNILELARKRYYEQNLQQYGLKKYAPEIKLLEHLVFFLAAKPECISHTIPDFRMAVKHGLRAIIDEAREREAATDDLAQREFYAAIQEVQEGIIGYSRNLAAEAEKLADGEIDPIEKQELLDIAQVHRQVPEFPARSFREALTSVWICWTAMHLENPNIGLSLGRLDQVLYDFYRQDLEQGRINVADAIELICCLWLKIGDHVPAVPQVTEQLFGGTGSNQAITLGGVDQDGEDAVNDLTYVMLRATELMKLRDPNLNARYYSGVNDEKYLRRLCEVNLNTGATPALHNDRAVIKSLMSKGDTLEQARDYGAIGCIEPGSNGRFYGASSAILLNLTSVLELALFNGKHRHTGIESKDPVISKGTGDPRTFATFTEFTRALEEQIRWIADQSTNLNNFFGKIHQDFYPTPILSSLIEGPLEKGRDLIEGGAVINSSGVTVIGLADVADSLSAIEELVFDEKAVSFTELLKALEKNFEGYEVLQTRLMNPEKTPKYGNEDAKADANVQWLVETLDQVFGEKPNYRGGHYRVGYWTMTNHAGFGKLTEAFPNGRKAYENFASGITPVSGVTPSLTKALNSVARLPVSCLSNGVPLNLKYTPECDRGKMLDNFVATVEGYFDDAGGTRDGGMEIQFNIVTHDTLVDAVLHPENNPQLLVRVSGFTAYFKDLNSQMQKEIIDRTEYLLSTRNMVPFEPFPLPKKE
jgi:formate C-acetyltransferase